MRHGALAALLLLIALAIAQADLWLLGARELTPMLSETIAMLDGPASVSAAYPPGIAWVLTGLRAGGLWPVDPWRFNQTLLGLGVLSFFTLSSLLLRSAPLASLAVLFGLLNPYFVWTLLLSRDAAPEFLLLTLLVCVTVYGLRSPRAPWTPALLALALATALGFTRVTGFFTGAAVLAVPLFTAGPGRRGPWAAALVGLTLGAAGLCALNHTRAGAFTLTTTSGLNLYLGHHPAYLDGHPRHDIDVFLSRAAETEGFGTLPEAERDQAFRRRAFDFMRDDPLALLHRTLVKSIWHWFNFEKIPSSSGAAWLDPADGTVHIGRGGSLTSLAYLLYKIIYIPLFVLALAGLARRRVPCEFRLLLAPLAGLWPLAVLAFPDTRFKIAAEVLLCPLLLAALRQALSDRPSADATAQVTAAASGS